MRLLLYLFTSRLASKVVCVLLEGWMNPYKWGKIEFRPSAISHKEFYRNIG